MHLGSDVLKIYRNRLTNLTGRNRSLLLTSLPAEQFIDLHDADFLLNRPSFDLITQLLSRKATIPVCDVLDARDERVNVVSRRLRRIARTARFIEDERGTEDLYVGWPFVRGKFVDGTVVHGPLLFFPVDLVQTGNRWQLTRRGDDRPDAPALVLNTSFVLAYAHFNQIRIGEDTLEKDLSDFDRDPLVFRTQLYEWLKTTPLALNFNPDLFTAQLQAFDRQSTKSLDTLERVGELKLYSEAVLGIFPQAGSYLVPDYDALIAAYDESDAVSDELLTDNLSFITPDSSPIREEHLRTPLPLDASQEAAVRAVKAGESVVVQGPPGTGKSQLIANLMADAAADGRRVLLVCQKRAALDVVYGRLRDVGMGPFVALIHDFQTDRPALYGQIAGQVTELEAYRSQNNSLNAVVMERSFDTESRRIDALVSELQTFKGALFDTSACGLSVKELYLTAVDPAAALVGPAIDLSDVYTQFRFDQLDDFRRRLTDYAAYQQRLGPEHPFANRVSFGTFGALAQSMAGRAIMSIPETARQVTDQTAPLFGRPLPLPALAHWQENAWALTAFLALANGSDDGRWPLARLLLANPTHPARLTDDGQYTELADTWDAILTAPGPEVSVPVSDLSSFQALLGGALAARGSWVSWNWWQLTNPGRRQLETVLVANALSLSKTDLQTLARRVDKRVALEALRQRTGPLLTLAPALPETPASLRRLRQAREVAERLGDLDPILTFLPAVWDTFDRFTQAVRTTLALAETVQQQYITWQTYLTDNQIRRVWTEPAYAQTLQQVLRTDFDVLVETDRLKASFSAVETTGIERLSGYPAGSWVASFQQALCLHWIEHIEQQQPILRSVSSLKMEQMEQGLQDSVAAKQSLSRDILLLKLREQTYDNLTVNRLNNLVTYRDLAHQTTKKRSIWPVRKLMSQFADEVFKLVPCWLASPESVSAMFPLTDDLFDLVIFDEASQCFAESGIPAMARGKQVVVAGDSQQLRPSDLYRIRLDADAAGEPDNDDKPTGHQAKVEAESLLELAAQTLPQVSLTGHYRSRSPELIEFSNEHFYGNKLTLLPDFVAVSDQPIQPPAIRYDNVNGIWQHNTNPIEADAVIALIGQLAAELPGKSVGVVTFNYQQQQLILEKLENGPERSYSGAAGEATFVKNIENVQGDERDVIIFSVGYAADEQGRLTMQFGSLNGRGGANRLNVAVTRARERIYVVTSLWPGQLAVEQSVNDGPKLLKAYLTYALEVAQGRFRPKPHPATNLRSSALLKNRLSAHHPDWQPELPFADLTELKNGQYTALILTDDDLYFQQTPKEAHAYLPFALRVRHWPFRRIWSREFWRAGQ